MTSLAMPAPFFKHLPALPLAVMAALWLGVVGLGLRSLLKHAYTPGPASSAAASWPSGRGTLPVSGALLVMFVHPHCPCSRASIQELGELMALAPGTLTARVYVELPDSMPAGWERTELWALAEATPGVAVITDAGGVAAAAFGASVSGDTQVYGFDGRLRFSGGLTPARGHQGDRHSRLEILARLATPTATPVHAPVFGCYLDGPSAREQAVAP